MSGSGGGGGGGGNGNDSPCETLRFDAQLTSPQAAVVAILKVDELLDIGVATMSGQRVVQVSRSGKVAGGLTGPDATRLRQCADEGHDFKAKVLSINGGQVRVRVEHV